MTYQALSVAYIVVLAIGLSSLAVSLCVRGGFRIHSCPEQQVSLVTMAAALIAIPIVLAFSLA